MTRSLDLDELVEHFTLYPDELDLLQGKRGANRLGYHLPRRRRPVRRDHLAQSPIGRHALELEGAGT